MRNKRDVLLRRSPVRIRLAAIALTLAFVLGVGEAFALTSTTAPGKKSSRSARGGSKSRTKKASSKRGSRNRTKVARTRRGRGGRGRRSYVAAKTPQGPAATAAGISGDRATEIQHALIKRGYLDGPPSGQWDDVTQDAVRHFQSDNRLPVTGTPSAHFLKKLGVSQRPADGYAVPVAKATQKEKGKEKEQDTDKKQPEKNL